MRTLKGPDGLVLEVRDDRPVGLAEARERADALRSRLLDLGVRGLSRLARPEVLSVAVPDPVKDEAEAGWAFVAEIVDRASGTHYRATGTLDEPARATVKPLRTAPPPTPGEIAAATAAVAGDPRFGDGVADGTLRITPGMPGASLVRKADGSRARAVALALHGPSPQDDGVVRLVTVDPDAGTIHAVGPAAPAADCGSPDDGGTGDGSTGGQVHVTVRKGSEVVWAFVVVRPAAQASGVGVGLSVRRVAHRGRSVLYRGDTPIVNVKYDRANHSGAVSYRDWVNEEAPFKATGTDAIPGYRLCPKPPTTLFDPGPGGAHRAGGNFTGVTFHWEGTTVVVTSLMAAGWYRYRAEWRFALDGTITPTFGFSAVENENTCDAHTHHCYWRLDFDVESAGDNAVERRIVRLGTAHFDLADIETLGARVGSLVTRWIAVKREARMVRGPLSAWRVMNRASGRGYAIYPGLRDGTADSGFGVGDVWALRYRPNEDRDSGKPGNEAHIDPYVNGESIDGADVVIWYAAHGRHDQHEDDLHGVHGHVVGPRLAPVNW